MSLAGAAATLALNRLTLSAFWGALRSIAVEIGTAAPRTAYSEPARAPSPSGWRRGAARVSPPRRSTGSTR